MDVPGPHGRRQGLMFYQEPVAYPEVKAFVPKLYNWGNRKWRDVHALG